MNIALKALAIAGLAGTFSAPAFAMDDMDMSSATCSDFMAMSQEDQMHAMDAMKTASMEEGDGDTMKSDDTKSGDAMETDDTKSGDAMESDDTKSGDAMESDDTKSGDAMESDDMHDDAMTAMTTACEGNPDMLAMDAMKAHGDK